MTELQLQALLRGVAEGRLAVEAAADQLKRLPFTGSPGLTLDTHRLLRLGFPEVVYGRHKTEEQIGAALAGLAESDGFALATQVSPETASGLLGRFPFGIYSPVSKLFQIGQMPRPASIGKVAVVCAGTSDLSVAEEAAGTVEFAGHEVCRVHDVGVAGLHRLLARLDEIRDARVVIAVAGMEGALPSVLAGLVRQPVVAVPTSVGYGANLGGLTALMAMMTSCSTGIGVVNVDNGFGAAMLALRMLQPAA